MTSEERLQVLTAYTMFVHYIKPSTASRAVVDIITRPEDYSIHFVMLDPTTSEEYNEVISKELVHQTYLGFKNASMGTQSVN